MSATVDTTNHRITAQVSSFGTFAVLVSTYSNPTSVGSTTTISGNPELTFTSSNSAVTIAVLSYTNPPVNQNLGYFATQSLRAPGQVYQLGPSSTTFSPAGVLTMRYDRNKLAPLGINEDSLAIYQFKEDGSVRDKLSGQILDKQDAKITAPVPQFYSLFAILGIGDIYPPQTQIAFSGSSYIDWLGTVVMSTATPVQLQAADLGLSTSGVAGAYYLTDQVFVDTGATAGTLYASAFTLSAGTHTLAYYSVDRASNVESVSITTVSVVQNFAMFPPSTTSVTSVSSITAALSWGANGNLPNTRYLIGFSTAPSPTSCDSGPSAFQWVYDVGTTSDTIIGLSSSTAYQFVVCNSSTGLNNCSLSIMTVTTASGVGQIFNPTFTPCAGLWPPAGLTLSNVYANSLVASWSQSLGATGYLLQASTASDFSGVIYSSATAATSATIVTLSPATTYYARVNAWNALSSSPYSSSLSTFTLDGAAGAVQALAIDGSGDVWEVFGSTVQLGAAKYSSGGAFISSTSLPYAAQANPWSIRFDGSGNAFVVGTSSGPGTIKNDAVVYKIGSGGSALVSSVTYNSSLNGDDLAYDATGQVWIAGSVPNSWGGVNAALLSFDPSSGLISLTTSYSGSAGVDAGTGITVDGSGNIWVVGFSSNPATQGANKLDLALWEFNPAGTSLLAGPFLRPGYMWYPDSRIGAKILASSSTLVVAASRLNTLGNTDLAVLTWDLYGNLTSTRAWHSDNGGDETPRGMAVDSSGNLVIVGVSSASSAIWTFSSTGAFISAVTVGTGAVAGVAAGGGNTWLALTSSSVPYKFTGGVALSGSAGIDGGIGTLGLRNPTPLIASLSDFYYRDIYAFPNPSRRNRGVTIRTQVGLADAINIHIYDISGQLVNQGNPADPRVFDDGNGKGPQWTYDYSWSTSGVGSGVYIYAVTAKKAGNADIKKVKKAAVIK